MKRIISLLLTLCLLLGMAASADGTTLQTEADVLTVFADAVRENKNELELRCSAELFASLSADNFLLLTTLSWEAGISNMYIRYIESDGRILLSSLSYGFVRYARAASLNDCTQAFAECAQQKGTELTIVCESTELFDTLWSGGIFGCAGINGIWDMYVSGRGKIIMLSDIEYIDVPQRRVTSEQDFLDAISEFAVSGTDEFCLYFDTFSYRTIMNDTETFRKLAALSEIDRYGYRCSDGYHYADFYAVTYSMEPKMLCNMERDIVSGIHAMGAAGEKEFTLVLNRTLYESVTGNSFEILHKLEAEAGMTDSSMWYNGSSFTITYKEAQIEADAAVLTTYAEAEEKARRDLEAGESSVHLFCTEQLYTGLLGSDSGKLRPIDDLNTSLNLFDSTYYYNENKFLITINAKQLYPGAHIVKCMEAGTTAELDPREVLCRDEALRIAQNCLKNDPLETARAIHDALCERIVYTIDPATDEDDTAIGALLNGEANCDGYSDAFYLVGTLAGLTIRCQHGDTYEKGLFSFGDQTHMWNLLYLDGSWRMVDVTWDDDEKKRPVRHLVQYRL